MLKIFLPVLLLLLTVTTPTVTQGPRIKVKEGTSTNWSGYAIPNTDVTDVKGSWVIPTVSCTSLNTYSSTWVGIDGYSNGTVEQTGTETDCSSGQPRYSAWYEMYPKMSTRVNLAVKPGDIINAEVKYQGGGKFLLTLTNQTTGKSFSTSQKAPKAIRSSAEWVVEAPWSGGVLPLTNFGTQTITNAQATINGVTGTISNWSNDPMSMVTDSGITKASPSSLSPDGSSFSVNWYHN